METGRWESLMEEALALALRGAGEVEPNPRVGALALRGGRVVGRGWHAFWGGPHAEVAALADAATRAEWPDTIVVTLEPCASSGKTPPCTEALLAAKIRTLVYGASDPDPRHRGRGPALLAEAGLEVHAGILAGRALEVAGPFVSWIGANRPWVIAKWAMSLDGRIATRTGASRWITPEPLRAFAHRLRACSDAVIVGLGTVEVDDPELTVRLVPGKTPAVVVVDPGADLSLDRKLVRAAGSRPLYLVVEQGRPDPTKIEALERAGANILSLPAPLNLEAALCLLRSRAGLTRFLCEGGSRLLGSLADLDLIDQVEAHIGPVLIGGREALSPLAGLGAATLDAARKLVLIRMEPVGGGLRIVGLPQ